MGRMLEDLDLLVAQFANELEYTRPVGNSLSSGSTSGCTLAVSPSPLRSVVVIQCFRQCSNFREQLGPLTPFPRPSRRRSVGPLGFVQPIAFLPGAGGGGPIIIVTAKCEHIYPIVSTPKKIDTSLRFSSRD